MKINGNNTKKLKIHRKLNILEKRKREEGNKVRK